MTVAVRADVNTRNRRKGAGSGRAGSRCERTNPTCSLGRGVGVPLFWAFLCQKVGSHMRTTFVTGRPSPGCGQEMRLSGRPVVSGLDLSSSKPWAGPSQRGLRLSWVSAPKTTLPCLFKGSSASLKCCCRFAPRGVDRIGSFELLIFSEFELPSQASGLAAHASSSSQPKYSGALCVWCMVGCLMSKCKRCAKE